MRNKKNYAIKMAWRQRGDGVGVEYITTFIFMIYDLCEFCVSSIPGQVCAVCFHLQLASAASSSVSHSVFLSTVLLLFLLPLWNEMHQSSEQH